MNWIEQHKAAIITLLITGIITFALFSIHITQTLPFVAETFIDITPADTEEAQQIEEFLKQTKRSDKAFNEDQSYKDMMKTFKSVPADDFEQTMTALADKPVPEANYNSATKNNYSTSNYALNEEERKRLEELKKALDKNEIAEHSKSASTFTYSLKDRKILYYDTPRYLCEDSGKVIVNIIVKADGSVKEYYINGATTTTNACLLNSALDYAKQVLFNSSNLQEQLGSVTFYFKPKLSK
ncbi:MAG: hypothetical protein AAGH46_02440 [Bacteroidota bacterium]